jgi:hypothetical protein
MIPISSEQREQQGTTLGSTPEQILAGASPMDGDAT